MSGGNSHLVAEALERICQTGQIVFVEEIYFEHSALLAGLRADLDFSSEEVGQSEFNFVIVARAASGGSSPPWALISLLTNFSTIADGQPFSIIQIRCLDVSCSSLNPSRARA